MPFTAAYNEIGLTQLDAVRGASEACDQSVVRCYTAGANERSNEEMRRLRKSYESENHAIINLTLYLMDQNNNKKIIATVLGVVALILIAVGFYYSLKANKVSEEKSFNPAEESTRGVDEETQVVDVKHQYKDGTHTFAGEIILPTPCHTLEVKTEKSSTSPNHITLVFTTQSTSEVCAEVISRRKFKTLIVEQKDIVVSGTLNGSEIKVNLFEVGENENLDTFEINVKG